MRQTGFVPLTLRLTVSGHFENLEIETKSPIGRLVPSTDLDQRRLLPEAAIFSYPVGKAVKILPQT